MRLPHTLQQAVTDLWGASPHVFPLTGGDVSHVALAEAGGERMVVKWKPNAPAALFANEADGLERLRAAGAFRVPVVVAFDDEADPPWLALEYIAPSPPMDISQFARRFGEALARLHLDHPAPDGCFGLDHDNYLGSQPQINTPHASWASFYRDNRLLPQIERAKGLNLLTPERKHALGQITDKIEPLMDGFEPRPVLIHGDLWSGNYLASDEEPVLIDPAVYYGEREVEMAYTELFGGFPPGFREAYHDAYPLDAGYQKRRPLHQLYPLLIHLNHFGEAYGSRLDHACRMVFGQ